MSRLVPRVRLAGLAGLTAGAVLAAGCQTAGPPRPLFSAPDGGAPLGANRGPFAGQSPYVRPAPKAELADAALLPKELNKVTMPPYTVEAPDLLLIDAQRLIPLPPYKVEPLDVLYVFAPKAYERDPINGPYPVDPDGTINLGATYGGSLRVNDLTVPEIEKLVIERLKRTLKPDEALATVSLAQSRGVQQIRGEHLVQPDGTVSLGLYGNVYVAGMSKPQVKQAIEAHLARYIYRPEVSVDVSAYNSKFYYVITDFAGSGEQVQRIPHVGNETVLDAMSLVGGLSPVSSKRIWIARPAPEGKGDQILPVDWRGVTRRGTTGTNYQVLPGDRVFVMGSPLIKVDSAIGRVTAPLERILWHNAVRLHDGADDRDGRPGARRQRRHDERQRGAVEVTSPPGPLSETERGSKRVRVANLMGGAGRDVLPLSVSERGPGGEVSSPAGVTTRRSDTTALRAGRPVTIGGGRGSREPRPPPIRFVEGRAAGPGR